MILLNLLQEERASKTVNVSIDTLKNLIEDCEINDFKSNISSKYHTTKMNQLRFSEFISQPTAIFN